MEVSTGNFRRLLLLESSAAMPLLGAAEQLNTNPKAKPLAFCVVGWLVQFAGLDAAESERWLLECYPLLLRIIF